MFGRHHDDSAIQAPLGACGYPQFFVESLKKLEATAHSTGTPATLILLSIENLSMIMSGYSMAVAEAVMQEIHALISERNTKGKTARVQRDQFGILIPSCDQVAAKHWCETLENAIRSYSYASRYGELHCIVRTAHHVVPDMPSGAEEILGRTLIQLTTNELDEKVRNDISGANSREEMGMANALGQAVEEGRIRLAYQPVIDSKTGKTVHYEGLLRLFGADGQITSAGMLIPIAERMGFMPMIDKLVLQKIIDELRADPDVSLALNVSNHTIHDPSWLELLSHAVDKTPTIASRLVVELTETALIGDLRRVARFCTDVQALGCFIALDDFGAGYTSFKQLKTLSVDMVKIDGAFIRDLTTNADSRFFVKTMVDFIHGFGLTSVAEFVETGEIAKILIDLGVDQLQGYYFGKP
ncbi:MAG: hypothetical protein B7X02_01325, partial [Rhodospirillales bacterium 12-54-5]